MPLVPPSKTCQIEVYGPDDEPARVICATVNAEECPHNHAGLITLECFGAGSAVPEAGVQTPGPPSFPSSRDGMYEGPILPQRRTAPGTPEVEPGAGNTANRGRVPSRGEQLSGGKGTETGRLESLSGAGEQGWIEGSTLKPERPSFVGSITSGGIPAAVPDSQTISGAQKAGLISEPTRQNKGVGGRVHPRAEPSAALNTPPACDSHVVVRSPRLKHRKRHIVRMGGMIRMPEKPEPPETDEESLFEAECEVQPPALPTVKAESELQRPAPKPEGDESELETSDDEEGWEQVIEEFETEGLGYVCGLEAFTDEDGDHVVTLTLDNLSIDLMLVDFLEILAALNRAKPRLLSIAKS